MFELWNGGNNVPSIPGNGSAIVAQQFNMLANPITGLNSGSIYGNDQISCGDTQSTEWLVIGLPVNCLRIQTGQNAMASENSLCAEP